MYKFIQISFLILIVFFSCKRNEEVFEAGAEYYPIKDSGSYIIYDVHQITYNVSGRDTLDFQLMEMTGDTITLNGQQYYKLLRFTRPDASATWPAQPDSVWSTYKNFSQAIKKENNIGLIKMTFPVEEGKNWDGNGLNTWGSQNYTIQKLSYPYTVNGHYFANTLTVVQRLEATVINENTTFEVYAKGVGLVHKSVTSLELCQTPSCIQNKNDFNIDSIISGVKYEQRFNSYQ